MSQNLNAMATRSNSELAEGTTFSPQQVELIKTQIAREATDDELMHFIQVASSRGLDPFRRHVYAVKRYDSNLKQKVMTVQVSIEGLRLIAERTGKYEGQLGPFWCGPDGQWTDVWLQDEPPAAAKVGIYKRGFREPLWGTAKFSTFVQRKQDGSPTQFWKNMPEVMIAKVSEAAALRRAFPEEAGGLFVTEEMHQADNPATLEAKGRVVDTDTGEIVDADPRNDDWEHANRRLHAIGGEHEIGHEVFHAWAVSRGHTSLRGVETSMLTRLAERIDHDPEQAQVWAAKLMGEDEAQAGQQAIELVADERESNRAYAEAVTR